MLIVAWFHGRYVHNVAAPGTPMAALCPGETGNLHGYARLRFCRSALRALPSCELLGFSLHARF